MRAAETSVQDRLTFDSNGATSRFTYLELADLNVATSVRQRQRSVVFRIQQMVSAKPFICRDHGVVDEIVKHNKQNWNRHGTVSLKFCFQGERQMFLSRENIPGGITNVWKHLRVTRSSPNNAKMAKQPRRRQSWKNKKTTKFVAYPKIQS